MSRFAAHQQKIWFWVGVTLAFFLFLYLIRSILLPFVVGVLTAYFLDPAADKLEEWGLKRGAATAIITVAFFSIFILFVALVTPMVIQQLTGLIANIPDYLNEAQRYLRRHASALPFPLPRLENEDFMELSHEFFGSARTVGGRIIASGLFVINLVSLLVITPVVAFYLLRDWDRITAKIDALLPLKHAPTIREQVRLIDQSLSGFLRGQSLVMITLGLFYAFGLTFVGLEYGFVIGLISGLLIIIPYLGSMMGGVVSIGIALSQSDTLIFPGIVLGVFVLGQILESYFLTPKLVGDRVGLHPMWILFGVLVGGALFGFVGVLIALPVTAIVGVLARFAISRYMQSEYFSEGVKKLEL
jgi:predicted PurR-regulated permease PerM